MDEVELSGVGLPSSATTDSNDTGGTPTSMISGSSPPPTLSPPLLLQPIPSAPLSLTAMAATAMTTVHNYNNHSASEISNEDSKKIVGNKDLPKVRKK